MPKNVKEQVNGKIYRKVEERNYREEMRRHQEREILEEFARVYGYDPKKHQPNYNNGEIDVEYLQAYVAECRANEEKEAKQKALAKQKEALKGRVSAVTKKNNAPQPQPSKSLTVEIDNKPGSIDSIGKSEKLIDAPVDSNSAPEEEK